MILVTNDDGVSSPGITALSQSLIEAGHSIAVVAPSKERSGYGMAMTLHSPLEYVRTGTVQYPEFSVNGTPADCVILAVSHLFRGRIEAVVSGINAGINAGFGILFNSGTISAALLAAMNGLPSIAFSQDVTPENASDAETYESGSKLAARITGEFIGSSKGSGTEMLNINFPGNVSCDTPLVEVPFSRKPLYRRVVTQELGSSDSGVVRIRAEMRKSFESGELDDISAVLGSKLVSITRIRLSSPEIDGLLRWEEIS